MFNIFGFYKFINITKLKKHKQDLQLFMFKNEVRGALIIAKEGINGSISRVISKEQANHCNSFYEILVSDRKKNNVPKTNTIGSTHISSIQEDDNTTSEAKGGDVVKKIIMTTT